MKCRADSTMLVQVVALLSLGMLCSSAVITGGGLLQEEQRSKAEVILREVLEQLNGSTEAPSVPTVTAKMERCMYSSLIHFVKTFEALGMSYKAIAKNLASITSYKSILPKDLDKECLTVKVTKKEFLKRRDNFLRLLFQEI